MLQIGSAQFVNTFADLSLQAVLKSKFMTIFQQFVIFTAQILR